MRFIKLFLLLPLMLGLGLANGANAQSVSNCDRSLGEQFLDVNNVRARILNTGGLFYRGEPHVYEVPKGSGSNAIFASGIWLAGQVNGQLRAAATRYGEWEMWAGPLDDNGNPPADCAVYDRVYKVSDSDVEAYDLSGATTPDLRDWPTGLGAPTLAAPGNGLDDDNDGDIDEEGEQIAFDITVPLASRVDRVVDLAAGERPAILGNQTIWWVMNDRGNQHESTDTPPIGIEVHGTAFAFNTAGDIGNTTFYKFNVFYKGDSPLTNAYMSIFSDPDLGDFGDDYVGSDTTLGVGYVYNSDNEDTGGEGYGTPPPAAGYDFFQGPIVPSPGDTAMVSGRPVPDFKNLEMTSFVYYNNGGGVNEDPQTGADYYNYMQSRWKDGRRITFGGDGFEGSITDDPVDFMYPGDPESGEGWSEVNPDPLTGSLPPNSPGDRRFVMSTGPFTINPGDQQEIVFGVVFSRGADHLNSVTTLRQADALAQAAFDVNFELPAPPSAPSVTVTETNGQIVLEWSNSPNGNNFLETYSERDPFAPDENPNYDFEGYRIYQFADVADQVGSVIATYDVPNGVTRVIDGPPGEPTEVVARGSDSGVQTYHTITNLTNYRNYYFGVQAYAYNEESFPKIYPSPITRVEVVPSRAEQDVSSEAVLAAQNTAEPDIFADFVGAGEGRVWVDIVNPGRITGETYTVEFREAEFADKRAIDSEYKDPADLEVDERGIERQIADANKSSIATAITYDIKRGGTVVFDGTATGGPAPQRENLVVIDGLQWSIVGPQPDIKGFAVVANAAGPLDPWDMGAFAFNSNGFPTLEGSGLTPEGSSPAPDRPTRGVQQSTTDAAWGIHTGGDTRSRWSNDGGNSFVERSIRNGFDPVGSDDYEMRFSQRCADAMDGTIAEGDCLGWRAFSDGAIFEIPFELWNLGTTPLDVSDDYRMIPVMCEEACGAGTESLSYDLGITDHAVSGGSDDPYTDWTYWYKPEDNGAAPGEDGYNGFFFGALDVGDEVFGRTVLVSWNGGATPPDSTAMIGDRGYIAELPETGTIFRVVTTKPSQPGDVFTVSTAGLGTSGRGLAQQQEDLDLISVVPNPYKGASVYERSQLIDQVRFTNLPDQATIRVYTLSGSLVTTIEKNSPARFISWDLTTSNDLPIASGMYLIHVDVPNVGSKVIKFGVARKATKLNVF